MPRLLRSKVLRSCALDMKGKCQLISKCLFGASNSPKNELENSNFCPSLLGQKFFVWFLRELKTTKCPFKINGPLEP